MDKRAVSETANDFRSPYASFGDLDAKIAGQLIRAGSDIALVLDRKGIIEDMSFGSDEMSAEGYEDWIGRSWEETVTPDSTTKIRQLLKDASEKQPPRWRQVNHPTDRGTDVPVRYFAMDIGRNGRVVAIGRDIRAVAELQQRLVQAQSTMEREYLRLRQMETRYRMLFEASSEAVLIVDMKSQRIAEVNTAAAALFGRRAKQMTGRSLLDLFSHSDRPAILSVLAAGRTEDLPVSVGHGHGSHALHAVTFRNDRAPYLLVRIVARAPVGGVDAGRGADQLRAVVENMPEGFVITDPSLRVVMANAAFLDLAHVATEDHVRGETLDTFIGRSDVDLQVLAQNLREHGFVRQFGTVFRNPVGSGEEVEIAAVSVPEGEFPCFGFTVRPTGLRLEAVQDGDAFLGSPEELKSLVGRMSLQEIVREATDIIERLCIETALGLTSNNRASAAEMLGLSRQSLYAKLRRHDFTN